MPTGLLRNTFDDVDQFAAWMNANGWDIVNTQLTPGAGRIGWDLIDLPGLTVAHYRTDGSMYSGFALEPGAVLLNISRGDATWRLNGYEVRHDALVPIVPSLEYRVVTPADLDAYDFFLSEPLLRATQLLPAHLLTLAHRRAQGIPLTEPATSVFLAQVDAWFDVARRSPGTIDRARMSDSLVEGLQRVIDAGLRATGHHRPRRTRRADLVHDAQDLIAQELQEDLSAQDIARQLGVSYRVLNYAFQDTLRVTPYRYLQTERLHAIRRLLRDTDVPIVDASTRYDIAAPGRFAAQYQRLFGELPSQTRAKRERQG